MKGCRKLTVPTLREIAHVCPSLADSIGEAVPAAKLEDPLGVPPRLHMGFLGLGAPYEWKDSLDDGIMAWVREHGIEQFLAMWEKVKDLESAELKWGDELEYSILTIDEEAGTVKCKLRGAEILAELNKIEEELATHSEEDEKAICSWVPEYGAWMVEGTPAVPYSGFASDLLSVEKNMRKRRARLLRVLRPGEICPTVPCFPLLGVGTFTDPPLPPGGPVTESLFIPDGVINPHPRFAALTGNIRRRRGNPVDIRMPRFHDTNTPTFKHPVGCPQPKFVDDALGMDEVYMDAMAFGMGCCCLQVTFQAHDVDESRHLYDQLACLTPMLIALTAATPVARGVLLDSDSRWDIISQSVDDRTDTERAPPVETNGKAANGKEANGTPPATAADSAMWQGGKGTQIKSRYDSISLFICQHLMEEKSKCSQKYNDILAPTCEEAYNRLIKGGVDGMLARHIAHLFSRDPLVIFTGRVKELNDSESTEHFENLQSTNWQTVRWKPPPASSKHLGAGGNADIGWRVEFRSMEVQMTDFENAAFTVFIVLVSRVILYFDLNLYVPLSKIDENMRRAQKRDALRTQKFWFAQSLMPPCSSCPGVKKASREKVKAVVGAGEVGPEEISILEMLTGKGSYRGLCPLIMAYLEVIGADSVTLRTVSTYLDFIVARAAGQLVTAATWMRKYIREHPDYKFDSVVSSRIATDLMAKCHRIGQGLEKVPEMYGDFPIMPLTAKDGLSAKLDYPFQRSVSHVSSAMDKYSEREVLMAKKRALQTELDEQRKRVATTESSLQEIEAQLKSKY